jgi:hypothetical protein
MYRNDCLRLFHRIIDHSLIIQNDIEQFFKEQAFFDTCQLYQQKFGEKYCSLPLIKEKNEVQSNFFDESPMVPTEPIYSYWDKTHFEFSSNSSIDYENPFSFTESDFILDGKWFDLCKQFMYKATDKVPINGLNFRSPNTVDLEFGPLQRLKKSYERFLYMAAKYPGKGFIPATYAV